MNMATPSKWFVLALAIALESMCLGTCDAANILGLFTSNSPSHLIVHMATVSALVERGHNVTVVSTIPLKQRNPGVHHIFIPAAKEQETTFNELKKQIVSPSGGLFSKIRSSWASLALMVNMQFDVIQDPRFQKFLSNTDNQFDLVIVGYFFNDFQLGIAAHFRCPLIISWMGAPIDMVNSFVGNPAEMSYVPNINAGTSGSQQMDFPARFRNVLAGVFTAAIGHFVNHQMEKFYAELFPTSNFPNYWEMRQNVSLVLCNSHLSEGPIRPNVPAIIEIGGIQIKEKPGVLPMDVKEWLDSAGKDGAVLFSLGSNIKSADLDPKVVEAIVSVLSSLTQKVIWKWETSETTPGNASNILFKKWLPQDDILAHPNMKLFITHAGKGGIAEAQYHAVPMIALPMFADQFSNAEKFKSAGHGEVLQFGALTADSLRQVILKVIADPTYSTNLKKFSELYRDRPMTARQTAVFWVEYVLRHHGAPHMQSPLVYLNVWQNFNIDVLAVLLGILYIAWRALKLLLKWTIRKCRLWKAKTKGRVSTLESEKRKKKTH